MISFPENKKKKLMQISKKKEKKKNSFNKQTRLTYKTKDCAQKKELNYNLR